MNKREVGKKYEDKAKEYLIANGYKILDTNFNCKIGEIDIIGKNEGYLCFIEVKYRDANSMAKGLYAVDKKKQTKIYKASSIYLMYRQLPQDTACRFDVVSIDGDEITLIKNAFP
jgi:putative endonuclease